MQSEIEALLNHLSTEKGLSPHTIAAYRSDLLQLMNFIQEQSKRRRFPSRWSEVSHKLMSSYVTDLRGRGYVASTIARKLAAAKSFFKFLVDQGVIDGLPTENLGSPRVSKRQPYIISVAEVKELLKQPEKHSNPEAKRDKAMMELLYASGMRVSELVALNLEDIDLQGGKVCYSMRGAKKASLTVEGGVIQSLQRYIDEARPQLARNQEEKALFLNRLGDRLTRQGFWQILKTYAKEANLGDKVTPKILRHSLAAHLLSQGEDIQAVQQRLGHVNIATTQIYTKLATKRS